jgi:SMODS-associating 2TM, beta-strand rich effector domain
MRPSRIFIQALVLVVGAVYLISYLIRGLPTGELFAPIGAAGAVASLCVLAFDHFLWRIPKLGFLISKRPDIRGTWRGRLDSDWVDPETGDGKSDVDVYLVVRQTFWTVTANLITKESKSCSTTATIEDDGCGQYQFIAQYRNTPRASVRDRSEVHHGSFKLDIAGRPPDRLDGYYWTDRKTRGELVLDARFSDAADSYAHATALGP